MASTTNRDGAASYGQEADRRDSAAGATRDEAALLERWAREYRLPLLKFFQKRAPAGADADDLVQDVFTRLARRADLKTIERIEGYLFQTAASVLADRFRRNARRNADAHESFDEDVHGETGITPECVLLGRQSVEAVIAALYELPERTRTVFALYHFDGVRQAEIAARLGVETRTVERHMAKATTHLLRCLGQMS